MSPTDIAREYTASFNDRKFDRARELLHSDYTYTGPDGREQRGPDAGVAVLKMWANGFPDARIDIQNIKESGDTVVVEFVGRGTHRGDLMGMAPTGKQVNIPVCNILELRDGKVYREREYMDMATMMAQLGVMPAGAPA
jgi:steroid delta-isomerase-like uncharacterized protein